VSDKTDQERALEYLKDLKTDAEIELESMQAEARRQELHISRIDDEIADIERGDRPQAVALLLKRMERHK